MVLKFKNPEKEDLKKIMVYGLDGTGKSTFAANYCKASVFAVNGCCISKKRSIANRNGSKVGLGSDYRGVVRF